MPFLEQQSATVVSEAHGLLFAWTTALWGRPILLADVDNAEEANSYQQAHAVVEPEGLEGHDHGGGVFEPGGEDTPSLAASEGPTQTYWAPSPRNGPQHETRALARQSSHRRRRLHAVFLGTPDGDDDGELD